MMNSNYVHVLQHTIKDITCPRCSGNLFTALMLVDSNNDPFSFELMCTQCNKRLSLHTDVHFIKKTTCQELEDMKLDINPDQHSYTMPEQKITFTTINSPCNSNSHNEYNVMDCTYSAHQADDLAK